MQRAIEIPRTVTDNSLVVLMAVDRLVGNGNEMAVQGQQTQKLAILPDEASNQR